MSRGDDRGRSQPPRTWRAELRQAGGFSVGAHARCRGREDALADAFAAALADWPGKGIPQSPEAWLLAVARRKAIDAAAARTGEGRAGHLQLILTRPEAAAADASDIPRPAAGVDVRLRASGDRSRHRAPLILQTCWASMPRPSRRPFLVAPATMGQRLARAKSKIRGAGIPFRVPDRLEMPERLEAVLAAIYAAFAEGWTDPAGTEARRRNLAEEGIWLGRLVVSLMPDEPEALGLLALMLLPKRGRAARRDASGEYVALAEQNTGEWDAALIDEAETLLRRASTMNTLGRYQLEAAVQSAPCGAPADWRRGLGGDREAL